jgi:hypothetical protein
MPNEYNRPKTDILVHPPVLDIGQFLQKKYEASQWVPIDQFQALLE